MQSTLPLNKDKDRTNNPIDNLFDSPPAVSVSAEWIDLEPIRGEKNHNAKLTPSKVRAIRTLGNGGYRRHQVNRNFHSGRVDTIFEDSKVPRRKWLYAVYIQQAARMAVSSIQCNREIGEVGKTGWFTQQPLRNAGRTQMNANRMKFSVRKGIGRRLAIEGLETKRGHNVK